MDNRILIDRLKEKDGLQFKRLNTADEFYNVECVVRHPERRRKNVIASINPTGSSFKVYKDKGWVTRRTAGIETVEEAVEWIEQDMDELRKP